MATASSPGRRLTPRRRKILDHFCVLSANGEGELSVQERWPPIDDMAAYPLPPELKYFVGLEVKRPAPAPAPEPQLAPARRRRAWFLGGGGGNSSSSAGSSTAGGNSSSNSTGTSAAGGGSTGSAVGTLELLTPWFVPFVLTGGAGERIYVGCLLRRSRWGGVHAGDDRERLEALVLLSRLPFFSLLHDLLLDIHSQTCCSVTPTSNENHAPAAWRNATSSHEPRLVR